MLQYTPEYTLSQNTTSNATLSYLTRGQAIGLSVRTTLALALWM